MISKQLNDLLEEPPHALSDGLDLSTAAANDERYSAYLSDLAVVQAELLEEYKTRTDLFARPVHLGLDSTRFTESQRNLIVMHMELTGQKAGLQLQVTWPTGRKGRLAMQLDSDEEDTRILKKRWADFLEKMAQFDYMYVSVVLLIDHAETLIDSRIDRLDKIIEDHKSNKVAGPLKGKFSEETPLRRAQKEKAKLESHKETLSDYREDMASESAMPTENTLHKMHDHVRSMAHKIPVWNHNAQRKTPPPSYEDDPLDFGENDKNEKKKTGSKETPPPNDLG